MSDEDRLPWWTRAPALRALIALAAVPGTLLLLGAAWLARGAAEAEALGQVLQAVMLTVVGFYFGGLGAERAERQALQATREAARLRTATAVTAEATDDVQREVARLLAVLDRLREDPAVRRKIEALVEEVVP